MLPAKEVYRNDTLLLRSLNTVAKNLALHEDNIADVAPSLKDRLLDILSKRALLTDSNLIKLLHKRVKVLDLSECSVSDTGLRTIAALCPQLIKLDLNSAKASRTEISPEGVVELAQRCHQLQVVYLRRCLNMTDTAVQAIAESCPHLSYLNIGGCTLITDASLEALGRHSRYLKSVNFSNSRVTDQGVFALANGCSQSSLKEIHMDRCSQITDEAVEAVAMLCPNLSILLFHGCPLLTDRSRVALEEMMGGQSKMKQVTWTIY